MKALSFHSRKTSFVNPKLFVLILILIVLYGTVAFGQTTLYVNPLNANDPQEDGSITHPYDSWDDISIVDNTIYRQLRGTADTISSGIEMYHNSNIKFGAYGAGEVLPILALDAGSALFDIGSSHNITIDSLHLSGEPNAFAALLVKVAGDWQSGGWETDGVVVTNCNIHHGSWNFFMTPASTTFKNITILNCELHHSWDDIMFFKWGDFVEVGYCNIHHANQKFFEYPVDAGGDGIQFHGTTIVHVHHCTIDRGDTGNKFCIIYNETNGYIDDGLIIIENNILITPNPSGNGGAGIFLKQCPKAIVRYNVIQSDATQGGLIGIYAQNDTLISHYNIFKELPAGIASGNTNYTEVYNCVFYENVGMDVFGNGGGYLGLKNNIFFYAPGKTEYSVYNNFVSEFESDYNSYNYQYSQMFAGGVTLGANSMIGDPEFVENGINFRLSATSPCVNVGTNLNIPIDYDSTAVPQGTGPEVGSFEFIEGTTTNSAPEIDDQEFQIDENMPDGQVVDTVVANDPDAGQILTYSITNGNTGSTFAVNPMTGVISIANNTQLNFETNPVFALIVQVQDNGAGYLTSQATITINLNDVNENPNIFTASFSVDENSLNGTAVGTVSASDPDNGQILSFSIIGGNTSGAFQIGSASGLISVANSSELNFETNSTFSLNVEVEDDGVGYLSDQAIITVNLNDINENPDINNQSFNVSEGIGNGELVGVVLATDPDAGQTLSFAIIGGNTDNAFQISSATGELIVANSNAIDEEANPVFYLSVEAQDNGTGNLTDVATITVTVTDVNEVPNISDQSFSVNENSPDGEQIGVVLASDPDAGQTLTYSIIGGNTDNAFQIDLSNGVLSVANSAAINFEVIPVFNLIVQVQDNGPGNLTNQADITVSLLDMNDQPVMTNQSFSIDENSANGQTVGTVLASDEDSNQTLSFSIISGNTDGAFQMSSSGLITVADASVLNFEIYTVFNLTVEVEDNGAGNLTDQATITVQVNDINEAPSMIDQEFSESIDIELILNEDVAFNYITIGTILISDPDVGQGHTFSITSGNETEIFEVDASTGILTLIDPYQLEPGANKFFLTAQVYDNTPEQYTASALMTVFVNLTDDNNSSNSGEEYLDISSGDISGFNCSVFPNPTSNSLSVDVNGINDEKLVIGIYGVKGALMLEEEFIGNSNMLNKFDVSGLSMGIYIVSIISGDKKAFKRFIKQ